MSSRPIDSVSNSSPNRLNRETNYKPETSDRLKLYSRGCSRRRERIGVGATR